MTISAIAREQVFQQDGGGFLVCLRIEHADIEPIFVVNNTVDIVSTATGESETFIAFPFNIALPQQQAEAPGEAMLTIDNVSQEIGRTLRLITSRAEVTIYVIRIDDFNSVEEQIDDMYLSDVTIDAGKVSGRLTAEDLTKEPYPNYTFSPAEYPGLLR